MMTIVFCQHCSIAIEASATKVFAVYIETNLSHLIVAILKSASLILRITLKFEKYEIEFVLY